MAHTKVKDVVCGTFCWYITKKRRLLGDIDLPGPVSMGKLSKLSKWSE